MRGLGFFIAFFWTLAAQAGGWPDDLAGWWLTPDQQGHVLFEQGRFAEAAERFDDPAFRAAAYYRAGDFERAAGLFGRLTTAEAAYNRGNALVMLGRYDAAIASYERAVALSPEWMDARENLALAIARKARLAPPESDAGGTGGQLEADEIVFDDSGRVEKSGAEEVTGGGEAMSEQEMRAVWLRRVQNDPADFLRARFAWQRHRQLEQEADVATSE